MPKKGENVKFKSYESHRFFADFEIILVPQDNGKPNPEETYTNKYQKHIACSYGYKLYVYDEFSKLFKTYLGEDAVYNFINSMIEENKYCSEVIRMHFSKELVMKMKILRTLLNVGSVIMILLIIMLK